MNFVFSPIFLQHCAAYDILFLVPPQKSLFGIDSLCFTIPLSSLSRLNLGMFTFSLKWPHQMVFRFSTIKLVFLTSLNLTNPNFWPNLSFFNGMNTSFTIPHLPKNEYLWKKNEVVPLRYARVRYLGGARSSRLPGLPLCSESGLILTKCCGPMLSKFLLVYLSTQPTPKFLATLSLPFSLMVLFFCILGRCQHRRVLISTSSPNLLVLSLI